MTAAHDDYFTTPTPGDLSARHVEVLRHVVDAFKATHSPFNHDYVKDEKCCARCKLLKKADEAIAALSALPAAGGEWSGLAPRKLGELRKQGWAVNGYALYRNGERGLIDLHGAVHWIAAPADVGAQGDGLRAALEQIAAETSAHNGAVAADRFQRIARDAPAAGKGVDDAMVERAEAAREKFWETDFNYRETSDEFDADPGKYDKLAMRAALEAALTRQPVAGDGWRPIESAPRDGRTVILCHLSSEPFMGRWSERRAWWVDAADSLRDPTHWQPNIAAPAATPTDGGEGS